MAKNRIAGIGSGGDGLVWPTSNATIVGARNILRDFKLTTKALGLPAIPFHDLRTLAATQMIRNGKPIAVIVKQLG